MASNTGQRMPPQSTLAPPLERARQSNRNAIETVGLVQKSKKHDTSDICRDFYRLGKCKYGEKCKYLHHQAPVDGTAASAKTENSSNRAGNQPGGLNGPVGERRPQCGDSRTSSSNIAQRALSSQPCLDRKDGKWKLGNRCPYSHEDTSSVRSSSLALLCHVGLTSPKGQAIECKPADIKKPRRDITTEQQVQAVGQKCKTAEKPRLDKEAEKEKRRSEAAQVQEAERQRASQGAALLRQTREKEQAARKVRLVEQEVARKAQLAEREAARKARLAEQEALQSAVTSQHIVFGSTLVSFSAGLEVKGLVTGFESCLLTIRNIPSDAKTEEIISLFTQQGMSQHEVHVSSLERTHDDHLEAKVLTSAAQGSIVALGLDGIEFRDERLEFEVGGIVSANAMGESNNRQPNTLTITWFAPSLTMIATYDSMDVAHKQQQSLDRNVVGGRRIKVEMNRPPTGPALRHYRPTSVKIMGLPMDTLTLDVASMAETRFVRQIRSNAYDLQEFLRDLQQHLTSLPGIQVPSFDRVTDRDSEGLIIMRARFENWEDANTARASLEGKRLRTVYPIVRLQLPPPLDFQSVIPIQQYQAQQRLWDTLAKDSSDRGPRVYIDKRPARQKAIIRLSGDEKKLVGALKVRVETLVAGEKLDAAYWHRSLLRPGGRDFLAKVFSSTKAYIRIDLKTLSLRIYGEGEAKQRARQMIEEEVARLGLQERTVLLKRQSVGFFVRKGLAALKESLGEDAVSLDLASTPCKLTIRGGEDARHTLSNLIDQSLNDFDLGFSDSGNDICPICYDAVSKDSLVLGCKHIYCTACIRHYITSASETKIFPLICMGDEAKCKVPIPIPIIQKFLLPQQYENLIGVAFSTYLDQHPQDFRYCTTPDCKQIYRANTESILKCPSCFAEVCSSCHEEAHEGMSCQDRQARKAQQEEQLNDSWATTHGVKRCPDCLVYIEKIEGCNHMTCRCGAHICWICIKVFPMHEIYKHLGEVHGGAFDGDGERQNLDLRHALALQDQLDEERDIHGLRFPLRPPGQAQIVHAQRYLGLNEEGRAAERREREHREAERREAEAVQRFAVYRQRQRQQEEEYQRQFNEMQERATREWEGRNQGRGCLIM